MKVYSTLGNSNYQPFILISGSLPFCNQIKIMNFDLSYFIKNTLQSFQQNIIMPKMISIKSV